MEENLVIVESPAKAKTIEKFLGKQFKVQSSFGHIRDLDKKTGVLIDQSYAPQYIIPEDKKKIVAELKKAAKEAKVIWLASDEDREGEAIAWHLAEVLKLDPENTRRIVFNEITKEAILRAIENPRNIDKSLVNAQQARRILDRLVGFEISPILWKKVKPSLSAGRVQSVSVRLIVEREREIASFESSSAYRIQASFQVPGQESLAVLNAELEKRPKNPEQAKSWLEKCIPAIYTVASLETKPSKRTPPPPFTTSTLQQEASRKLGFSVSQTMSVAQKLYENGKISYMRTDSVNLSEMAIAVCKKTIEQEFGNDYSQPRRYKTKTKGAQEAHEAIRPVYPDQSEINGTPAEKKLYDLIRKRTLASQMSDASLEKTTVTIHISTVPDPLIAVGEVIKFDGFLKLYNESSDEEKDEAQTSLLPPLTIGQVLTLTQMVATERFTQHPPRYTEASLVKKLEELGIGRPSTYAPTISTIQQRGYVTKENREGVKRNYRILTLKKGHITETVKQEINGAEKNKLFPEDIGMVVTDFLITHFPDIMNYNFTATVEKSFDEIAEGNLNWVKMIDDFYKPFHNNVIHTEQNSEKASGERVLGTDPVSGKPVIARIGRFGAMVQIGESSDGEKPRFASLLKSQRVESICLEDALKLFSFPRKLGVFEEKEVTVSIGRFGPYIQHNGKYASIDTKTDNPAEMQLERAIEIIENKRLSDLQKIIKTFDNDPQLQVLNGRFGPYLVYNKENYKIPKEKEAASLSYEECMKIISEGTPTSSKSKKTKTASKTIKATKKVTSAKKKKND